MLFSAFFMPAGGGGGDSGGAEEDAEAKEETKPPPKVTFTHLFNKKQKTSHYKPSNNVLTITPVFKAGLFKKKEEAVKKEAGADDSKAASAMAMLSMRKVSDIMT